MNKVEEELLKTKESLFSLPQVKEYLRVRDLVNKDQEIASLRQNVIKYRKEMKDNFGNDDAYFLAKQKLEETEKKLNSHPLIVNFENLKEEILDLLNEVKTILD